MKNPLKSAVTSRALARLVAFGLLFPGVGGHSRLSAAEPSDRKELAYSRAWQGDELTGASALLKSWAGRYQAAPDAKAKAALFNDGIAAAKAHRAELAALAKSDPRKALASAVPAATRKNLPSQVEAELEVRISGIGDFAVMSALPAKNGKDVEALHRQVTLNGKTYPAYVYGRRLDQTSRQSVPLHGILVDGIVVLHETALRALELDELTNLPEVPAGQGQVQSGGAPVKAQLNDKIYRFNSAEELQQVEAKIESAEGGLQPLPQKSAIQILEGSSSPGVNGANGANPTTPWTTGLKNILIIRVDFSDIPGDPQGLGATATAAYCQNIADTQVAPYYLHSSYGLTTMSNTVTTQLYRMPQTATFYATNTTGNSQLHTDAETAAAANYNVQSYDRIIVVFSFLGNIPGSFITYGGLAQIVGKNVWVNSEFDFRVVAHELGHTYGLFHAGLLNVTDGNPISAGGTVIEYGDDFDTMGANFANDENTDFSMFNKNQLGWISDSQVLTVTTNGATARLYAFDSANFQAASNHSTLAVKVVKDSQRTYWVGIRRNFTANSFMQNGAYVEWAYNSVGAGGGGGYKTALIDFGTPGGASSGNVANDFDAALAGGITFGDGAVNLSIRPSTQGGGAAPDSYLDVDFNGGGTANLAVEGTFITGGNGNGIIDPNECNNLFIVLTNLGALSASNITASLSSSTPGAIVSQKFSNYPDLPRGAGGTNFTAFNLSTAPNFICGTPVTLALVLKSDQFTFTNTIVLPSGTNGAPLRFDNSNPVAIPDNNPAGTNSFVTVSNIVGAIGKVSVSVNITHTFDSDLALALVAPDGTTNILSLNHGGSGNNYGLSCADNFRTTFTDDSTNLISAGTAPFVGSFQPDSPLSVFTGKSGTNVNGVWALHVVDSVGFDVGTIQCWSLLLSPALCTDGGGQCPGADLAIGMTASPEPVFVGSNLVYNISVTNNGPNTAKSTIVSHVLPGSTVYVSAASSQGTVSQSGGIVTANLGNLAVGARATVSVIVTPTTATLLSSTASVTSSENDFDPSNNSVTVLSHVNPPFADLSVSIIANPDPVPVGGTLVYTVFVTNRGPSSASGVVVSNVLPISVGVTGVTTSQGSSGVSGNFVICNLGSLLTGGFAAVTISVVPSLEGSLTATTTVSANQTDPVSANNFASVTSTVAPSANLAIGLTDNPDPIVLFSNLTYTINVTNLGPSTATSVMVNQSLPASVSVVSSNSNRGVITVSGSSVSCDLGTLTNGERATITIVVATSVAGNISSSASVSGAQGDPDTSNNSASVSTLVSAPVVNIVAAGATLTGESFPPGDGTIEPGETVTVQLRLQNIGNVANAGLVATLLATNGVTNPSGPRPYGILKPVGLGGFTFGQPYTFTANGTNGQVISATLQLQDGATNLGLVSFNFTLPTVNTFSNVTAITIPDSGSATPYPSTIHVAGLSGLVGKATVTLSNMSHTFPHDVSVLLVGPAGGKTLLMSHAAEGSISGIDLTFDDNAATALPGSGQLTSASYQPGAFSPDPVFPSPAPAGPYGASLGLVNGTSPNGDWSLYIVDDSAGDQGNIAGGWSLTLTMVAPVNQVADLSLGVLSSPNPVLAGNYLTNIFSITNAGPNRSAVVAFTNVLPPTVSFVSATSSQGTCLLVGNSVVGNLGGLNPGSNAVVTIVVIPNTNTSIISTGVVSAAEIDLNPGNNTAVASVVANLPSANLAVTGSGAPNPVTVGSNVTYTIVVTNTGPEKALSVLLSNSIPAGTIYVSSGSSQGTVSNANGIVVADLGTIASGSAASVGLTVTANAAGSITNISRVSSFSTDANLANNIATVIVTASNRAPVIVTSGMTLIAENFTPANAAVEPGETVTLNFQLANIGAADTTNLVATLQASGGVTSPSGPASYGALIHTGAAVGQNFTFTASPSAVGTITASLQLQDGAKNLGTVSFLIVMPASGTFSNVNAILIPDHGPANPYPSTIFVSGLTGLVNKLTVNLNGITHAFPDDLDILLVSPAGRKVMLMSDAGGGHSLTNLNLGFDDAAAASLPDANRILPGTYKPTDFEPGDVFPPPVPSGVVSVSLASLQGANPNGTWSLFVVDDSTGDAGTISGGWSLAIHTIAPVNPTADISVTMTDSPHTSIVGGSLVYNITVSNSGPSSATGVVLTDTVPPGVNVMSATSSQGSSSASANHYIFNFGSLASGAGATATLHISPMFGGVLTNTIVAAANENDLDPANNSAQTTTFVAVPLAPRLSIARAGAQFEVSIQAEPNLVYVLQASADLVNWTPVSTNTAAADGSIKFTTLNAQSFPRRFYRAQRLP